MKAIAALILAGAVFALSGCNTIQGLGQDIEKLGSTIEGAARK